MCLEVKTPDDFYFVRGIIRPMCKKCDAGRMATYDKANKAGKDARNAKFIEKHEEAAEKRYLAMKEATAQLTFKPLTDRDWFEICDYFNGCALCGSEVIETREFVIQFKKGGRYAPWNIFPKCGTCSTNTRFVENPFRWFHHRTGNLARVGITRERAERLLQFFEDQVKKAQSGG